MMWMRFPIDAIWLDGHEGVASADRQPYTPSTSLNSTSTTISSAADGIVHNGERCAEGRLKRCPAGTGAAFGKCR